MALKALLTSTAVAALADPIKGEYREPTAAELKANPGLEGHMLLDVTDEQGFGLDNTRQLKETLGTEKARADKAEADLAPFAATGVKPRDLKARLEKLGELEKLDPDKEADRLAQTKFDSMKQQLVEQHKEEKKALEERTGVLFTELDKSKRVEAATKAIVDAGGNPDVLLPHVLGQTKFVEKDGKFDVQVIDTQGNPRIGDAGGGGMTLPQLVDEFKAKDAFAPLFAASGTTGGGTTPSTQNHGGQGAPRTRADLDLNAKAEYIEKNGMEAYLALPEAPAGAGGGGQATTH